MSAESAVLTESWRVISLAHVLDPARISIFPGDPPPRLTEVGALDEHGYRLRVLEVGEHTGTHWGAPAHFTATGCTADELDPGDLLLPAVKVDVRDRAAADPDYAVTVADLRDWEDAHGPIPPGAAVIAWTGWESRWGTDRFANIGADGHMHQPGFAVAAVRWLLDTGRLHRRGALGIDTFGPDRGIDTVGTEYTVSKLLYREHRISLECLAGLAELPEAGALVLAGGVISAGGTGSPGTIFGLLRI
ncbi:cyclase family protein [Aldersonia sp. NBC_00410]|uniref:cyclase family protein n=1 Tax=Aldersonia sp. NBC_00410 TaxID=2975954 RepID=UPI00224D4003|nr:cyclase family protein [Aldersonia sp. NBC_00410]MCX5043215.1 cyclase family protein [Aldersonia sp. NBC_00410]